jgi:ribose-phosphate pyrophosphokinase
MRFPWDKEINEKAIKVLDLRQGFGEFEQYKLSKFPDNSIKFILKKDVENNFIIVPTIVVRTRLLSNDDIIALALVKDVIDNKYVNVKTILKIDYMMYQQDDRRFKTEESFGLKIISNFINSMKWDKVEIFHPHSDKVEFIDNCIIKDNTEFISHSIQNIFQGKFNHGNYRNLEQSKKLVWVIPDSGAFKTQFKQIGKLFYTNFITCMKSRNHETGEIETIVNTDNLLGRDCFIVDDICLGGRTFIQIAQKLKEKNCGKLYLIVSHGLFNYGIEPLLEHFEFIYTTDSICSIEHERLKIHKV